MYSIGQVAEKLHVSSYTLRYYEKEGIILPDRNTQGERIYSDDNLSWLKFVLKLKETQMPIVKIREYAQLFQEGDHTKKDRLVLLKEHQMMIKKQIETLIETEALLEKKITLYEKYILE